MSNLKPLLVEGELKFLDENNYEKAKKIGKKMRRMEKMKKRMKVKSELNGVCLGGQTEFSSRSERQNSFRNGDCLPVMLVPGVMGSRMKVILDCEKISAEVEKQCDSVCSNYKKTGSGRFITEIMWITLLEGVARVLNNLDNYCLGLVVMLDTNNIQTDYSHLNGITGIQSVWNDLGNSLKGECGLKAIQNLDGDEEFNFIAWLEPDLQAYKQMASQFIDQLGYVNGVNLFAMPYDFRQVTGSTDLKVNMKRTLEWSYKLNGKRMLIIAHSLGGLNTQVVLASMSQLDKDKYVERLVTIGTPFNGSPQMNILTMGVKRSYNIGLWDYGMGVLDCRHFYNTNPSFYSMMQNSQDYTLPSYLQLQTRLQMETLYKEQLKGQVLPADQQQALNQYILESKDKATSGDKLDFIPFIWEAQFTNKNIDDIGLRIRDQSRLPMLQLKDKSYKASLEDTSEYLKAQSLRADIHEKQSVTDNRVDALMATLVDNLQARETAPGVPLSLIYSAQLSTVDAWQGDAFVDPIQVTSKSNDYYQKGLDITGRGDSTVNTFGALIRPLKWAHQFQQKQQLLLQQEQQQYQEQQQQDQQQEQQQQQQLDSYPKYPLELIEYGFAGDLYDVTSDYIADLTQNTHKGILGSGKSHAQLIADPVIITLVSQMAIAGQQNKTQNIKSIEQEFTNSEQILTLTQDLCVNLYADNNVTTAEQLQTFLENNQDKQSLLLPREIQFKNQ